MFGVLFTNLILVKFPNFHTYSIPHFDVLFCIVLY
nr:MAG TPA: hypothetical protein [Caudoviricetes sp.]